DARWMPEELLMMRQGRFCLPMFVRLLEHLKTRDDASLHFIQGHQPPEFDVRSPLVARNDAGVRFKEAQDSLLCGDLLPLYHAGSRLSDRTPYQLDELPHLVPQVLGALRLATA